HGHKQTGDTMKLRLTKRRDHGMNLFEILIVIVGLFILALMLFAALTKNLRQSANINCRSNLKQINMALKVWEIDHNNLYPMAVSVTNGGAKELIATGNVAAVFLAMSNELSTTKILCCPADTNRT